MNTTVTATGMKVTANAEKGLYIAAINDSDGKVGTFAISATASNASATLAPVSTVDCYDWYAALAADATDEAASKTTFSTKAGQANGSGTTLATKTNLDGYALVNRFVIKTTDGTDMSDQILYISSVTSTIDGGGDAASAELNKSLRVAVVITPNYQENDPSAAKAPTKYYFAPWYSVSATETTNCVSSLTLSGDPAEVTDFATSAVTNYTSSFNFSENAATTLTVNDGDNNADTNIVYGQSLVTIYVYYEGQDGNNYASNTANGVDNLTVEVKFAVKSTK